MSKPTPKIGDVVFIKDSMWCAYGQITKKTENGFLIKVICAETGKLFNCPDKRCDGLCVICCYFRKPDGMTLFNKYDIQLFQQEGMLHKSVKLNPTQEV